MKIQSPAILAIGLVVSLTSAIAGSFAPTGAAGSVDKAAWQTPPIVEGRRPVAVDAALPATTHPHFTEVEHLASDR